MATISVILYLFSLLKIFFLFSFFFLFSLCHCFFSVYFNSLLTLPMAQLSYSSAFIVIHFFDIVFEMTV